MQIVDEWIAALAGKGHGVVERFSALHGEAVGIDHTVSQSNGDAGFSLPDQQGSRERDRMAGATS